MIVKTSPDDRMQSNKLDIVFDTPASLSMTMKGWKFNLKQYMFVTTLIKIKFDYFDYFKTNLRVLFHLWLIFKQIKMRHLQKFLQNGFQW